MNVVLSGLEILWVFIPVAEATGFITLPLRGNECPSNSFGLNRKGISIYWRRPKKPGHLYLSRHGWLITKNVRKQKRMTEIAEKQKPYKLALSSAIFAFLVMSLPAIICGHMALSRINHNRYKYTAADKRMAIWG